MAGLGAWLNPRAFSTYFKRLAAVVIMGTSAALLVASLLIPAGEGASVPVRQVPSSLTKAPISALAVVSGKDEASLLAALGTAHPGATANQSLSNLVGGDAEAAADLLATVYAEASAE